MHALNNPSTSTSINTIYKPKTKNIHKRTLASFLRAGRGARGALVGSVRARDEVEAARDDAIRALGTGVYALFCLNGLYA